MNFTFSLMYSILSLPPSPFPSSSPPPLPSPPAPLFCWHIIYIWSWRPWLTRCHNAPLPDPIPPNRLKPLISIITQLYPPVFVFVVVVIPAYEFDSFSGFRLSLPSYVDTINLEWRTQARRSRCPPVTSGITASRCRDLRSHVASFSFIFPSLYTCCPSSPT